MAFFREILSRSAANQTSAANLARILAVILLRPKAALLAAELAALADAQTLRKRAFIAHFLANDTTA